MAEPPVYTKSEDIAEALKTRLSAILLENDCETDIGSRFMYGRRKIDDNQIPCCVLHEGEDTPTKRNSRTKPRYDIEQRYILGGYDFCDPLNPNTTAHKIIRDLKRAIFQTNGEEDGTLGGKVLEVEYLGKDIGPRSDGGKSVFAVVEIVVRFVEAVANP
jgi:hypothetical protein